VAGLPDPKMLKEYYDSKQYTFNLREFWNKYVDQEVTNWRRLVDKYEEVFKQKTETNSSRIPDFELRKESRVNDMNKIYREVFGKDGEWMHKRFLERKAALARLKERGVSPITIKDVDREMMCRYGIVQKPTP